MERNIVGGTDESFRHRCLGQPNGFLVKPDVDAHRPVFGLKNDDYVGLLIQVLFSM